MNSVGDYPLKFYVHFSSPSYVLRQISILPYHTKDQATKTGQGCRISFRYGPLYTYTYYSPNTL